MKMGIIAPRAGIEPTSAEFGVRMLTITPLRLSDVTTLSMPTCLCGSLHERSVQTTTLVPLHFVRLFNSHVMLTVTCRQYTYIYRIG